jgi:hypothetical protein
LLVDDPSVVEATLTADEMHAGAAKALTNPAFPDATTVAMFAARSWSMIAFIDENVASHGELKASPPMLMLTAAML